MKVNFIIIGAQKSATSTAASILEKHPDVCFCKIKEPGFFSDNKDEVSRYHEFFTPTGGQLLGEASTMYTMAPEFPGTPERIFEYNPQMKLIYILRNPVDRIESHYAHRILRGRVPESNFMLDTIVSDPTFLNRSRYYMQIMEYLKYFKRENLEVIFMEDLIKNNDAGIPKILRFLGLKDFEYSLSKENKSEASLYLTDQGSRIIKSRFRYLIPGKLKEYIRKRNLKMLDNKPKLDKNARKSLFNLLREDIDALSKFLNMDLSHWN